jgi:hypothetical protein
VFEKTEAGDEKKLSTSLTTNATEVAQVEPAFDGFDSNNGVEVKSLAVAEWLL